MRERTCLYDVRVDVLETKIVETLAELVDVKKTDVVLVSS